LITFHKKLFKNYF